jgi:multiple sugar transport system permease protein
MATLSSGAEIQAGAARRRRRGLSKDRLDQMAVGYLFLLPDVLGLLVFVVAPMLFAFYISLNKWTGFTPPVFSGLANYRALTIDPRFRDSLMRSATYALGLLPTVYVLALGIALLINREPKGSTAFRTVYFMPVAMSLVIASILWRFLFEPSYGLANFVLQLLGLPKSQWLGSVQSAMYSVLIVTVWKNIGYFMIILLAGIQDIPQDYVEAARIDGANSWQLLRRIIMPPLKPTSFFVLVILGISSLQAFDQIYVLTRGGPAYATYTVLMYIYETAFQFWKFGYASAMSIVLFLVILSLTIIQVRFFRSGQVD